MIRDNLDGVRQRIARACQRRGRDPSSVTLVAVTKGVVVEAIGEAVALGVADVGENRVQEARIKKPALGSRFEALGKAPLPTAYSLEPIAAPVRWHLVGHLQSNKVKAAAELFDVIHSVDSVELIRELEKHAADFALGSRLQALGKSVYRKDLLIQVNVAGDPTKFGCAPGDTMALVDAIQRCPHLSLRGLMTVPPLSKDPESARPHFRQLRLLRDKVAVAYSLQPTALSLSMGMSQDFEVAIEEGADLVRIGTAIFGTWDMGHGTGS